MSKARNIADLLDANGDVKSTHLDNVPPADLVNDTTPQLGGDLDLNSNNVTGTGNIPAGNLTGSLPAIDGSALTGINTDLVADTTPQLGGDLDLNNNNITGTGNIPSGNLTGALPAIDGSNLTGVEPFPSGTKQVFVQASAPTGWTQDTTNNDKALRVVSGTGAGTGGTWALSSGVTSSSAADHTHSTPDHSHNHNLSAGSHTLTTSQMPSHSHSWTAYDSRYYQDNTNWRPGNARDWGQAHNHSTNNTGSSSSHSHSLSGSITSGGSSTTGAGGSHSHTVGAPQYLDVIVASKD